MQWVASDGQTYDPLARSLNVDDDPWVTEMGLCVGGHAA
jgi:hypothetical protein